MRITELIGRHHGEDIYVIGSGGSLNYLDPDFFADKVTIGINKVASVWMPTTYSVTKYWEQADRLVDEGHVTVVSACQHGSLSKYEADPDEHPDRYVFRHVHNHGVKFRVNLHWPGEPDMLVVSWSTITSGMHLAAVMGAANIIMVGADGGTLGESTNVDHYYTPDIDQSRMVQDFEDQTLIVKRELMDRYGVRVYGLSPFINPNLEGVPFVGRNRINC